MDTDEWHNIDMLPDKFLLPVADRGVSGPWGPIFCGALCKGVTQCFPAGGVRALQAPTPQLENVDMMSYPIKWRLSFLGGDCLFDIGNIPNNNVSYR